MISVIIPTLNAEALLAQTQLHAPDLILLDWELPGLALAGGLAILYLTPGTRRLVEQDPSNAGWQRELAVAHSRVGDVLQAQGQLAAAQAAFGESLAISRRLVELMGGSIGVSSASSLRRRST